ncbi:hypothetical protein LPJ81_005164 [Coemansia sp. IMI 209127]|nr:hypothetical protein LPJ81_005164 [Coemansia sp. IMI 209127]
MFLVFCDDDAVYKEGRDYPAPATQHYSRRFCSSDTFAANTATSTDYSFGAVATIPEEELEASPSSASVSKVDSQGYSRSPSLSGANVQSPYAVRDIDELLVELGVAETALIFDTSKDKAQNRESFCSRIPHTSRPFSSDPDEFSLKEIDELIEQLETDRTAAVSLYSPSSSEPARATTAAKGTDAAEFRKFITDTIRSLGNIVPLAELVPQPISAPNPRVGSETSDGCFGNDIGRARPLSFLDVSGLVSGLGAVIVPELPSAFIDADPPTINLDVASLVYQLGRPETVAAVSKRKDRLHLHVPGRIAEHESVLVPRIPSENIAHPNAEPDRSAVLKADPLDVASLVRGLGNPETVTPAAKLSNHGPASQCLDIPDIIASLGGVYLPTFRASVIDKICEVDIQALFDKPTAKEDNAENIATVATARGPVPSRTPSLNP